jgi:hypothetical protein
MDIYTPFEYSEVLPDVKSLPKKLKLTSSSTELYLLIRIISGTIDIQHNLSGSKITLRDNYSKLSFVRNETLNKKIISDFLDPIKFKDFERYLDQAQFRNKRFYQNLLGEFSNYFFYSSIDSHTTAFIHLYRSIEYISYTFPLIYASISKDYFGSFEQLKSYFKTANSELKFFNTFLDTLFNDTFVLETPLTFNIISPNETLNEKYFKAIKRIIPHDKISAFTEFDSITTNYGQMLDFIINLRNRYFHFLSGTLQDNLSSNELMNSDLFFEIINKPIFNWIAYIFATICKEKIKSAST